LIIKKYLFISLLISYWSCEDSKNKINVERLFTILKVLDETSGDNCLNGGIKIIYGIDQNNDGVLSSLEIDNSFFICSGIVIDIDGNRYSTVTLDGQTWMVENLKTTKYNDGIIIPNVTLNSEWSSLSTGAYSFYNNDSSSIEQNGYFYNWYTVETNKLCPMGWHVPTNSDWTILERFLAENGVNYDGVDWGGNESNSEARSKIAKSLADDEGWTNSSIVGSIGNTQENNNYSRFTGRPSGSRSDNGTFYGIGTHSRYWTASENSSSQAIRRVLSYDLPNIRASNANKGYGFCIRCVSNN